MESKAIYTLDDLRSWSRQGSCLALIGDPVAHSISPQMYNAALAKMAKTELDFKDWAYFKFQIQSQELQEAMELFHQKHFVGLNVTAPHKMKVLPFCDTRDPMVDKIHAANTLLWEEGSYRAMNTDITGVRVSLEDDLRLSLESQSVVILGAGGAARAAIVACVRAGCESIWVGNRSSERLEVLMVDFPNENLKPFLLKDPPQELKQCTVVINATALGLKTGDPAPLQLELFTSRTKVMDMVYTPNKTSLMHAAESLNMPYIGGEAMLVAQGAEALSYWTQLKNIPTSVMRHTVNLQLQSLCPH